MKSKVINFKIKKYVFIVYKLNALVFVICKLFV